MMKKSDSLSVLSIGSNPNNEKEKNEFQTEKDQKEEDLKDTELEPTYHSDSNSSSRSGRYPLYHAGDRVLANYCGTGRPNPGFVVKVSPSGYDVLFDKTNLGVGQNLKSVSLRPLAMTPDAAIVATEKGLLAPLRKFVSEDGYDINIPSPDTGDTIFHHACTNGHLKVIRFFFEETSCNTELRNFQGLTGIDCAFQEWHLPILQYQLRRRAIKSLYSTSYPTDYEKYTLLRHFDLRSSFLSGKLKSSIQLHFICVKAFRESRRLKPFEEYMSQEAIIDHSMMPPKSTALYVSLTWSNVDEPDPENASFNKIVEFLSMLENEGSQPVHYLWIEYSCIPKKKLHLCSKQSQLATMMALVRCQIMLVLPPMRRARYVSSVSSNNTSLNSNSAFLSFSNNFGSGTCGDERMSKAPEEAPSNSVAQETTESPKQSSFESPTMLCFTDLNSYISTMRSQLELLTCLLTETSIWCYYCVDKTVERFHEVEFQKGWFDKPGKTILDNIPLCKLNGGEQVVRMHWGSQRLSQTAQKKIFTMLVESMLLVTMEKEFHSKILLMKIEDSDLAEQEYSDASLQSFTLRGLFEDLGTKFHAKESLLGVFNATLFFMAYAMNRQHNLKSKALPNIQSRYCCLM